MPDTINLQHEEEGQVRGITSPTTPKPSPATAPTPVVAGQQQTQVPASTAKPATAPAVTATTPATTATKRVSYVDEFLARTPYKAPSPEDLERERKRRNASRVISAIGDGLSALANLHFTTKYSPNVDQRGLQLSARNEARYQQIDAQRQAMQKEYEQAYQRARMLDDDRADKDRSHNFQVQQADRQQANWDKQQAYQREQSDKEWKYKSERDKVNDDRWKKEFDANERHRQHQRSVDQQQLALQRQRASAGGRGGSAKPFDGMIVPLATGGQIMIPKQFNNTPNMRNMLTALRKAFPNTYKNTMGLLRQQNQGKQGGYNAQTGATDTAPVGNNSVNLSDHQAQQVIGHIVSLFPAEAQKELRPYGIMIEAPQQQQTQQKNSQQKNTSKGFADGFSI